MGVTACLTWYLPPQTAGLLQPGPAALPGQPLGPTASSETTSGGLWQWQQPAKISQGPSRLSSAPSPCAVLSLLPGGQAHALSTKLTVSSDE